MNRYYLAEIARDSKRIAKRLTTDLIKKDLGYQPPLCIHNDSTFVGKDDFLKTIGKSEKEFLVDLKFNTLKELEIIGFPKMNIGSDGRNPKICVWPSEYSAFFEFHETLKSRWF